MPQTDIKSQFDVIVVGAGAAGLYTALCMPAELQVGLITKETVSLSASDWAQGGIAAAIAPEDSPSLHIEDTIQAGVGLCDRPAVEFLAKQAPSCIQSLVNLGVAFDRHDSHLALTLEAAHSRNRVLHAADTTGREVTTTLTAQVLRRQNIQVIQQALALSLWLEPETRRCQGISLFYQGHVRWIRANAVVLATGGGGQVFAQSTNPAVSTGDGVAIAWRAGAILRDLEFVQFHPTALTKPGRFLISEAVRGEGAHLVDNDGRRFAFDYHPAGELAPRDVVSRAIFSHLQRTSTDPATAHVWLDMRPIPAEKIRLRFPNIIKVCQHWGVDVFSQPIPVAPAAHYWMGGIVTDLMNRTNIPGLYAVGETTSTGVHGANRLASNSLLECIVFGAQMADLQIFPDVSRVSNLSETLAIREFRADVTEWKPQQEHLEVLRDKIPRLLWQSAGICREQSSLESAIATLESWQQNYISLPVSQFLLSLRPTESARLEIPDVERQLRLWAETRNLLDVAFLILKSAAFRTESRGGHYRLDYPQLDPDWQVHTLIQQNNWWKSPVFG
ncbi:L-aspartate oxidase [Brasilonema bromeliae]|uniref:L-aspartate oxidase n=1 Tax=Brasilonema bromeliae SPC951 TaxID=385972 RepID=A0ABX1P6V8_9CYAN|nr:L-aspartate oxidase [Brasilonema bromeliae]NMG19355.1 L-aspartate oxidase [Brasilonema bromeliae SPC951]